MKQLLVKTSALGMALGLAAACGNHHDDSTGAGDGAITAGGDTGIGSVPGDTTGFAGAFDVPVMTEIPIPPNCQSPGFPGGDQHYDFDSIRAQLVALKPDAEQKHADVLAERYDLSDNPSPDVTMTRGKNIQVGVRVKLAEGVSWDSLAAMAPATILKKGLFPQGFLPLPHPNHQLGGQLFTHLVIDELNRQTNGFRDLTRFDVDFDFPDHILPEFPPAIFLTNHEELGDVSQGKVVTIENFYDMFKSILNPQELEGLPCSSRRFRSRSST